MREAIQRCRRWRRIRAANCVFRSGKRAGLNFISSFPATTRAVSTDSSRCAGVTGVGCTEKVTELVCTTQPCKCGMSATGSKFSEGVLGLFMGSILPAAHPSDQTYSNSKGTLL